MNWVTLDQLVRALNDAYMTPDSPTLRQVLSDRHAFPITVQAVREQYGKECAMFLVNTNLNREE
jgi:hypothetical protein